MNRECASQQLSITLCSESFWPQFDTFSWWANDFCRTATSMECSLRVITTRPTRDNPANFCWHGVEVQRIFSRPQSQFNWFRSSRPLQQALSPTNQRVDCLLINQSARNAITTLNLAKRLKIPVVLRVNERWLQDDKTKRKAEQIFIAAQQMKNTIQVVFSADSLRGNFQNIDALPSATVEDGVLTTEAEFDHDRNQQEIRKSLADAHPIFQVEHDQPLVVLASHFNLGSPAKQLVVAWNQVRRRFPRARLWIVGQGPGAREIWNTICHYELTQEVIMPGQFDQILDLYHAANLFVVFGGSGAPSSRYLKLALASGTAILVEKTMAHYDTIADASNVIVFENRSSVDLANLIIDVFQSELSAPKVDQSGPSEVAEKHHFRQTVEQYVSIMKNLVENAGRRL